MVLEAVYEQDFLDCSYGFRSGRSPHDALKTVWKHAMDLRDCWLLEADIEDFFGSADHTQLREVLSQRVRDGVLLRLIGKWLNAGVMEEGRLYHPETGVPQGGVMSPMLSNIFLHEVLDLWFVRTVRSRLRGRGFLTRFADDFVMVFEREEDARRVQTVLAKRFAKYGLRLHPEKTKLMRFRPPSPGDSESSPKQSERSFDLLGLTLYWGLSRKQTWVVKYKTRKARFSRALCQVSLWCREHRHEPIGQQQQALAAKLRGHYGYYGVTGNAPALARFAFEVRRRWHYWLARRSNQGMAWERMNAILRLFPLPPPRVVHSVCRT